MSDENTGFGQRQGADLEILDIAAGIRLVTIRTRLDIFGVERIDNRFKTAVSAPGGRTIVDLSGVDFVASIGLQMLIAAARLAHEHNAKFVLFGASGPVRVMFEHVAISAVIGVANDEAAALALVKA